MMKTMSLFRRTGLALLVFSASLFAVAVVQAQEGQPHTPTDDEVNAVAKNLYCPVCPNTPLDVCETQACKDWRAQIRDQLSQGWTQQEIIDYFVVQYGERVLAEPQRKGFTSFVWLLPIIAAILGGVVVWQVLRSWRDGQASVTEAPPAPPPVDPEVLAKIEKELQELE